MCGEENPQCEFSTKHNPPQSWISVGRHCRNWPSSSEVNLAPGLSYSRICWCDPSAVEEKCKALTTECSGLFDRSRAIMSWTSTPREHRDACSFTTLQYLRVWTTVKLRLTTASGNHHYQTTNFLQPCLNPAGKTPARENDCGRSQRFFPIKQDKNAMLFDRKCDSLVGN